MNTKPSTEETDSISKDKISKYYSIYQGNKSLFDNNDQLLNLYELVESKSLSIEILNKDIKNANNTIHEKSSFY